MAERAEGFRLAVRQVNYRERRHVGCELDCQCPEGCTCPHHLVIDGLSDELPDAVVMGRIAHLVRLEAMINVGCKFGPNDLAPDQWSQLIVMAEERNWMEKRIDQFRERQRKGQREIDKALSKGRKELNIPAPGGSIFSKPAARKK